MLLAATPAAAAQRTFVRSDGIDSNPCTLQQPCRGFAAAILLTDPNGEIVVLDSAGYGSVTVTKAVSIIAPPGVYAGISVFAAQDGVTVNAGATDKVVCAGSRSTGRAATAASSSLRRGEVQVENCDIANMGSDGIQINGGSAMHVVRSTVRSNASNGIRASAAFSQVFIEESRLADNALRGLLAEQGTVSVNRTAVENNGDQGIQVQPASGMVSVAVRDSLIVGNSATGLLATATLAGDVANVSIESTAAMRNGSSGFAASTSVGTVNLVVSGSASIDNGGNGVLAFGYATVSVSASTLSRNAGPGLVQTPGRGTAISRQQRRRRQQRRGDARHDHQRGPDLTRGSVAVNRDPGARRARV